jgi:hypothetical protein
MIFNDLLHALVPQTGLLWILNSTLLSDATMLHMSLLSCAVWELEGNVNYYIIFRIR